MFVNVFRYTIKVGIIKLSNSYKYHWHPERPVRRLWLNLRYNGGFNEGMHSSIGCICLTFLQFAFLSVPSNCQPQRRHCHTGRIYLTFLHYVSSNVTSNRLHERMYNNIGCMIEPAPIISISSLQGNTLHTVHASCMVACVIQNSFSHFSHEFCCRWVIVYLACSIGRRVCIRQHALR